MLDINLLRNDPEKVRENIRKKFQEEKLPMVDEVIRMDREYRDAQQQADGLRNKRKTLSKQIGALIGQGKKDEAEAVKAEVAAAAEELAALEVKEEELKAEIRKRMLVIPNIIDDSVPIGKDDSENVEIERFGEPAVPAWEIPYHVDIMERLHGIELDPARETSGNGFYYLTGDIARLHSAILSYARDFMIDRGFTYVIPPFMIHGNVVSGVMSFAEMENMMYKIEGEDLYLIGTSEHSMIGKFIDTILDEESLPQTLTSYSPCFRKEVGAHGIEERGVYRIHQFEKQEMIVICKPEDSPMWFDPGAHAGVLQRRPGGPEGEEPGRGSLVSPAEEILRGRFLLEPGRRPGPAAADPREGRQGREVPGPYAEQHLRGAAPDADRLPGEQPAGRRHGSYSGTVEDVYGREGSHRLMFAIAVTKARCA